MNNTVLYCRTANSDKSVLESQLKSLYQYGRMNGYEPNTEYCDWNESGLTLDRPSMQKLLADIRAGEVKRIIVKNLSRFSRNLFHINELNHLFCEHDVEVVSVNDGGVIDMTGPILNVV